MIDRSVMRNDVGFLRRRPHRNETPATFQLSEPSFGKLNFDRPDRRSTTAEPQILRRPAPLDMTTRENAPSKISFDRPSRHPAQPPTSSLSLSRASTAESSSKPAQSDSGVSGLSLGGTTRTAGEKVYIAPKNPGSRSSLSLRPPMDAELPKHSVPYFRSNTELSLDKPAVRLDFRQSAIGSITITGPQAFAWEMQNKLGGIMTIDGKGDSPVEPPLFGGRRIIEFHKGDVVIGIRHAARIRRAVFASHSTDLRVKLYDGSEIFMPSGAGDNVLLLSRIGHELEFRMEAIHSYDLLGVFSIKASQVIF